MRFLICRKTYALKIFLYRLKINDRNFQTFDRLGGIGADFGDGVAMGLQCNCNACCKA